MFDAAEEQVDAAITNRRPEHLAGVERPVPADYTGRKTGPFAWTGGELAFSFMIPMQGGNSGPVEMALAPRRP